MDFTEFSDYRDLLKCQFSSKKVTNKRLTLDYLANETRIQKSYISRAFNKYIHFSSEQVFKIGTALKLPDYIKEYSLLLVEYQKSSDIQLSKYIEDKMNIIKNEHSGAKDSVNSKLCVKKRDSDYQDYYTNPIVPIVHMYLCIQKYNNNRKLLLKKMNIEEEQLTEAIEVLEKVGLIEIRKNCIMVLEETLHIPKNNRLSKVHQINQRVLAQNTLLNSNSSENMFFSASFSTNEKTFKELRKITHSYLKELKDSLEGQEGDEDEVYHVNIDLFS